GRYCCERGARRRVVAIHPLDTDLISQVLRIVPHTPDEARPSAGEPGQPEEVHARNRRHSALLNGVPAFVQHAGDLEPGVVDAETGRPDHSADAHGDEVELEDRVADTLRIRAKDVSLGLRWQVESIAF